MYGGCLYALLDPPGNLPENDPVKLMGGSAFERLGTEPTDGSAAVVQLQGRPQGVPRTGCVRRRSMR
jgi:hypothetical protein